MGLGAAVTLTEEDVIAMEREIPTVAACVSSRQFARLSWFSEIRTGPSGCRARTKSSQKSATGKWNRASFSLKRMFGRRSRVIVLGKTVADKLFPGIDPIGETIRVRNLPFRVVGVLEAKGQSMVGQDQDDTAIMPYTTVQTKAAGPSDSVDQSGDGFRRQPKPDRSWRRSKSRIC